MYYKPSMRAVVWTTSVSSSGVFLWPLVTPSPVISSYLLHCQSPALTWPMPPVALLFPHPEILSLSCSDDMASVTGASAPSGSVPALGGPSNVLHALEVHSVGQVSWHLQHTSPLDSACWLERLMVFVLDPTSLSSFVSTLSPESPALPTALCLSINPLDWWAVPSVVWSFGLQKMHLLYFLLKLAHGSVFWAMPLLHGHIFSGDSSTPGLGLKCGVRSPVPAAPSFWTICSLPVCRPSRREFAFSPSRKGRLGLHMSSEPEIILRLTEYNFNSSLEH